jgi:hypothetical protein
MHESKAQPASDTQKRLTTKHFMSKTLSRTKCCCFHNFPVPLDFFLLLLLLHIKIIQVLFLSNHANKKTHTHTNSIHAKNRLLQLGYCCDKVKKHRMKMKSVFLQCVRVVVVLFVRTLNFFLSEKCVCDVQKNARWMGLVVDGWRVAKKIKENSLQIPFSVDFSK